jgi:hypothetical protein
MHGVSLAERRRNQGAKTSVGAYDMPCIIVETGFVDRSERSSDQMAKSSSHTWIVDVIEDGSASIEVDGRSVTPIPEWMLPVGVKEGDVLAVTHEREEGRSVLRIRVDAEAKKKAMERSVRQVSRKSKRDRGGDIQL